jgi:hypothetical protein
MKAVHTPKCFAGKPHFYEITGLFLSMHRHTGQGSAATADPVSSATVKRRSLLPIYFFKQGTKRFAFWHLRWIPARRSRSLAGPE